MCFLYFTICFVLGFGFFFPHLMRLPNQQANCNFVSADTGWVNKAFVMSMGITVLPCTLKEIAFLIAQRFVILDRQHMVKMYEKFSS